MKPAKLTSLPQWHALQQHFARIGSQSLRQLFAADPRRGERLTAEAVGLYMDYSKQCISADTVKLLCELAEACELRQRTEAMFHGEKINTTENRAVLHVALRAPAGEKILVDGHNVVPDVHQVLDRMSAFADQVRGGLKIGAAALAVAGFIVTQAGQDVLDVMVKALVDGLQRLGPGGAETTAAGGQAAALRLLARPDRPTAIFAASDEMAIGALRAARELGLRVPEDVSVVGVDDHEMARYFDLTTVAQPVHEQGRVAATQVLAALTGDDWTPEQVILPTELVVRRTTSRPGQTRT